MIVQAIQELLQYRYLPTSGRTANRLLTINLPPSPRVCLHLGHPTPIGNIFDQLKTWIEFSADGLDPITEADIIRTRVLIIEGNCLFPIACREWRAKASADRTISTFKTHFWTSKKEYRRETTTAKTGYNAANAAL